MGRGRSNWTKLHWAFQDYQAEYLSDHLETYFSYGAFRRQLERSRWFKKNFVDTLKDGRVELQNLEIRVSKLKPGATNAVSAWFTAAGSWPLHMLRAPTMISTSPVTKGPNGRFKKAQSLNNRYLHLTYAMGEAGTEIEYRKRAQFFLILIQHFLGREEAKKLLRHYRKHEVKYRKTRTDRGNTLTGADLIEFRMRLGGHSLLVPPLSPESESQEANRAHGN